MKTILIITCLILSGCSSNWYLRRSQQLERKAIIMGAQVTPDTIVKTDTVFKERIVYMKGNRQDSLLSNVDFNDTIYNNSDSIKTKIKVNVEEGTIYESVKCPDKTKIIKEPYYINKKTIITKKIKTDAPNVIKWWWLLIAFAVGILFKVLWK